MILELVHIINHTILPNGHCVYLFQPQYTTLRLLDAYAYVNGIIQVSLLVAYFVYYYKFNKMLTIVRHLPNTNTEQNRLLFKITIMMGASLAYPQYFIPPVSILIMKYFFLIQQCVILFLFVSSKRGHDFAKRDSVLQRHCHNVTIMTE